MALRIRESFLILVGISLGPIATADQYEPVKIGLMDKGSIAQVLNIAAQSHITEPELSELSIAELTEAYLKSLDYYKVILLKEDVDHIRSTFEDELTVLVPGIPEDFLLKIEGRMPPLYNSPMGQNASRLELTARRIFQIGNHYISRHYEMLAMQKEMIDGDLAFDTDRQIPARAKHLEWANSKEELRARLKDNMISSLIKDMITNGSTLEKAKTRYKNRLEASEKTVSLYDSDTIISWFLNAYLRTLDPHSRYYTAQLRQRYIESLGRQYAGIGIEVNYDYSVGKIVVAKPIKGGPAIQSGIRENDVIEGFRKDGADDEYVDASDMDIIELTKHLRGPVGRDVCVSVVNKDDGSEPRELCMKRATISRSSSSLEFKLYENDKLAVIQADNFYYDPETKMGLSDDVREFLNKNKQLEGLVIDLRGNGGGVIEEAQKLSGLFLNGGPVVQVSGTDPYNLMEDPYPAEYYDLPLVVLVDSGSASASEIFAAAMKDRKRALIVGGQTYGKGTVQKVSTLITNSGAAVTFAGFYRVDGRSTQFNGVKPHVSIPQAADLDDGARNPDKAEIEIGTIEAVPYVELDNVGDKRLARISRNSERRIAGSPSFRRLKAFKLFSKSQDNKAISLNLETRTAAYKLKESLKVETESETDFVLDEAKAILCELL